MTFPASYTDLLSSMLMTFNRPQGFVSQAICLLGVGIACTFRCLTSTDSTSSYRLPTPKGVNARTDDRIRKRHTFLLIDHNMDDITPDPFTLRLLVRTVKNAS